MKSFRKELVFNIPPRRGFVKISLLLPHSIWNTKTREDRQPKPSLTPTSYATLRDASPSPNLEIWGGCLTWIVSASPLEGNKKRGDGCFK